MSTSEVPVGTSEVPGIPVRYMMAAARPSWRYDRAAAITFHRAWCGTDPARILVIIHKRNSHLPIVAFHMFTTPVRTGRCVGHPVPQEAVIWVR